MIGEIVFGILILSYIAGVALLTLGIMKLRRRWQKKRGIALEASNLMRRMRV